MDTSWERDWFTSKLELADKIIDLNSEDRDYHAPDAIIILCCAISALAAKLWPGKRIDKDRFIQLLIDFSSPKFKVKNISIPLLIKRFSEEDNKLAVSELKGFHKPDYQNKGVTWYGAQLDQPEQEILKLESCKDKSISFLRSFSYASLIYSDLRNALIHEFTQKNIVSWGDHLSNQPCYGNLINLPHRLLFIPYRYIKELFLDVSENLFDYWDTAVSWEKEIPDKTNQGNWWRSGK